MKKITLQPDGRWHVPFEDSGSFRVGVYSPEFYSAAQIDVLEKHTCPELFICTGGRMGLLLSEDGYETEIILQPGEAVMVTEHHNGFMVDREGFFIVVEQTAFSTEYIDRKTGKVLSHEN
ncbi:MAG: hypothetical protein ACOCWZ_03430 [Spirochaetota bacterium]